MTTGFLPFLIDAKRHTYASQGDNASVVPLLSGSRQLEYRRAPFLYRDIYFGMAYFVGQETVYQEDAPLWSMSYAGGVDPSLDSTESIQAVYRFLRVALRQATQDHVFRGPPLVRDGDYTYANRSVGSIFGFHGEETIAHKETVVYTLRFSGGRLR